MTTLSAKTKTPHKYPTPKSKVTHLYLHDKYLPFISNLAKYTNLTILYLHNNEIEEIKNLNHVHNLIGLYLQKNKIRKIDNLDSLVKLKRLYLGHNKIRVVENLEKLASLEELHVEKQELEESDAICFDPRTISALSNSLQVLNVSHNNLTTIDNLSVLKFVRMIDASCNRIKVLQNIVEPVKNWYYLEEARFTGNPVCKEHRYRESLIGNTVQLCVLDGKQINDTTRSFIKRFEQEKVNFTNRKVTKLPDEITDLTKNYPLAVQKAVSGLILRPSKISDMKLSTAMSTTDAYIPWRCMPKSFDKVPPSLQKHKKQIKKKPPAATNLPSFL